MKRGMMREAGRSGQDALQVEPTANGFVHLGLKMKTSLFGWLAMLTAGLVCGASPAAEAATSRTAPSGSSGQEGVVVYNSRLPES